MSIEEENRSLLPSNTGGVTNTQTVNTNNGVVYSSSETNRVDGSTGSTTTGTTVSIGDAVLEADQAVSGVNNIRDVVAPTVSYDSETAVNKMINDVRNVNLLPTLSAEDLARLQESINTLGSGEKQIRMMAENSSDSRETADMLADIYKTTSKYGGINLLGATAVLASREADRAERQQKVAEAELALAKQNRGLISQNAQLENANLMNKLKLESDLLLKNADLQTRINLANAGYDINSQTTNVGSDKYGFGEVIRTAVNQQNLNKTSDTSQDSTVYTSSEGESTPKKKTQGTGQQVETPFGAIYK